MVEALVEQVSWLTPTSLFVLLNLVIATILVSTSFHSRPNKPHHDPHNHPESSPLPAQPPPALARTPSLFSRVTSFNLSNYYPSNTPTHHHDDEGDQQHQYQYQQQQSSSPSFFTRVASFKFSGRTDEQPDPKHEGHGYQEPESEPATPSPMKRDNNYNKSNAVNRVQQVGPAASVRRTVPRAPSLLSRVRSFNFSGVGRDPQEEAVVEAPERHEKEKVVRTKVKKENKTKSLPRETTSFMVDEEVDNKADDFINRFKQQLKLQRIESLIRQRSA